MLLRLRERAVDYDIDGVQLKTLALEDLLLYLCV